MLPTAHCTFVNASDVLRYMGYDHNESLKDKIFWKFQEGNTHTIVPLPMLLDFMLSWLDDPTDITWTNAQHIAFDEKANALLLHHTLVDMEH